MEVALDAVRRLLARVSGGFLAEGEGYLDAVERIGMPQGQTTVSGVEQ